MHCVRVYRNSRFMDMESTYYKYINATQIDMYITYTEDQNPNPLYVCL